MTSDVKVTACTTEKHIPKIQECCNEPPSKNMWNVQNTQIGFSRGHPRISYDKTLFALPQYGRVIITDVKFEQKFSIDAQCKNQAWVGGVCLSPDNKQLAVGYGSCCGGCAQENLIKVFDVQSGKRVQTFDHKSSDTVWSIQYSPNGKYLAAVFSRRIIMFDVVSGEIVGDVNNLSYDYHCILNFENNESLLMARFDDKNDSCGSSYPNACVNLWRFDVKDFNHPKLVHSFHIGTWHKALALSNDNKFFAFSYGGGDYPYYVKIFDLTKSLTNPVVVHRTGSNNERTSENYSHDVTNVSFDYDGKYTVFGYYNKTEMFDMESKTAVKLDKVKVRNEGIPLFSPNGTVLVSARNGSEHDDYIIS